MTAKKRMPQEECKDALMALRDSVDVWGGKWKLFILLYLSINQHSPNYFMEMVRNIPGISAKMLSKELKGLELNKLVTRIVHDTKPVTVEYIITPHGKSFLPVAESLIKWGVEHRKVITAK